jgi:hypothetical protein
MISHCYQCLENVITDAPSSYQQELAPVFFLILSKLQPITVVKLLANADRQCIT